ncbi:aminotransferase isoform A [Micractinium conductrix]|uniref:Aminotransferase isoform A n=1 Tax=Micractinium conductrix TaxID=554055 RepID=A0A2P6VQG6_9CHLO|nr:aminotransferase isoform A [Micractinium conductrix]|eukprot:PSC76310.1 aminotransferase isoform A [Micractinium conductrix]
MSRRFNDVFSGQKTTVFETMSIMAAERPGGCCNLGQGFPDNELEGPEGMKQAATAAMLPPNSNQYPPMMGLPELRQAVAAHSGRHAGLPVDWQRETLVTVGATEALAAAFLALLNAGDEVIFFEPLYDSYVPMARRAGAVPRIVQLHPPSWSIDAAELEAAFSPRTRLLVLNTPHNPTGKVFNQQELELLAALCQHHDCLCLLDEVYEHLVFPGGAPHVSLRSLPGMADRCLRIGSAGKTFSFTAWKVGWLTGPADMVAAVAKAHQFITFTVPSAMQRAVAHGLEHEQSFYSGLGPLLQRKRQLLAGQLQQLGFSVLPADGTYFLVADFGGLLPAGSTEDDVAFCQRLVRDAGVALIPASAFYADKATAPRTLVRFVFCKTDEKLQAAVDALRSYLRPAADGTD